ncbi:hypothetical protein AMTRI_Chr11g99720 [Amborella trichopoda]
MTATHDIHDDLRSITAGSREETAFCWKDETGSGVISLIPKNLRFRTISAGGFHGSLMGRSLSLDNGKMDSIPTDSMISIVGSWFHSCGMRARDKGVSCWGFKLDTSTTVLANTRVLALEASDYFTCGVLASATLQPVCWGSTFPTNLPMVVSPGICYYEKCQILP